MLSRTTRSRLTTLAKFMETLGSKGDDHFYMGSWVAHKEDGGDGEEIIIEAVAGPYADSGASHHGIESGRDVTKSKLFECGMTACAFGWACVVPELKKQGLRIIENDGCLVPSFDGETGWDAAKSFFGLSSAQANRLFNDSSICTPEEWAEKCRAFLRKGR